MNDNLIVMKLESEVYNESFRWECRELSGRWNPEDHTWSFPSENSEDVERLKQTYNRDFVNVELTFLTDYHCFDHRFFLAGYPIACGAYTKAYFERGVKQIKGEKPTPYDLDHYLFHKGTMITLTMTRALLTKVAQEWKGTLSLRDMAQSRSANDELYCGDVAKFL